MIIRFRKKKVTVGIKKKFFLLVLFTCFLFTGVMSLSVISDVREYSALDLFCLEGYLDTCKIDYVFIILFFFLPSFFFLFTFFLLFFLIWKESEFSKRIYKKYIFINFSYFNLILLCLISVSPILFFLSLGADYDPLLSSIIISIIIFFEALSILIFLIAGILFLKQALKKI